MVNGPMTSKIALKLSRPISSSLIIDENKI